MERGLSDFPLLDGVSAACRRALTEQGTFRRLAAGVTLYRVGTATDELFALLSGRLKVGRVTENGAAVTLDILTPGDVVGLAGALSDRPHGVAATCLVPTEVLTWRTSLFLDWMRADSALAFNVSQLLTRRLRAMADLVEELAPSSVEPRLARLLLRLAEGIGERDGPSVRIEVTQRDLAELARTTVPTVSRILTRWRRARIMASYRGSIVLHEPAQLTEIGRDLG